MGHCYHHALSSVKKWGGVVEDYLPLHQWFDEVRDEAPSGNAASPREHPSFDAIGNRLAQRRTLRQSERDEGGSDREQRWNTESHQPGRQRRHVAAEDDEIYRIGNRQDEACRIRNEGTDKEMGQRLCLGGLRDGVDSRGQNDGSRIV